MRHRILEEERKHRDRRQARLSRARRWLRRLPRRSNIHSYPILRHFAAAARARPYLWGFERGAVRRAIYAGAVVAFLPIYGLQILIAFAAAIVFRANLAVACALQVVTNPLTAGPLYLLTYRVGRVVVDALGIAQGQGPVGPRVKALVIGGLLVGLVVGLVVDLAYRFAAWEAGQLRRRHHVARQAADELRAGDDAAADLPPAAPREAAARAAGGEEEPLPRRR